MTDNAAQKECQNAQRHLRLIKKISEISGEDYVIYFHQKMTDNAAQNECQNAQRHFRILEKNQKFLGEIPKALFIKP